MGYEAFWAEVAYWAEVPPVLVEVRRFFCASSVSADSLLCHFGMEGSHLLDFHKPLLGVFLSQPSPVDDQETQLLASSLLGLQREVSELVVAFPILRREKPRLAILAIFKARRMSDYSSCTRPHCLAIVADMLKTYKKLDVASKRKNQLFPQPYTTL